MELTITDTAIEKLKEAIHKKNQDGAFLRVFVTGGGCSGYQYRMAITDEKEDDDVVIETAGVKIVVDPESMLLLKGAEIDYQDDLMKAGFTINNPNATKSCACGTSFQAGDNKGQAKSCC